MSEYDLEEYSVRPKFLSATDAAVFIDRLGLPTPQAEALAGHQWIVIPDNAVLADPDPWSTKSAAIRVWDPFCVMLYGGDMEEKVTPDNSMVVWDSRRFTGLVPATTKHPLTGRILKLRGLTREGVQAWPVRRGDHVFVPLTETRAMQIARMHRDGLQAHDPAAWDEILRSYDGNETAACEAYAQAMVASGAADLTTATEGWLEQLGEPESRMPDGNTTASPQDLYLSALLPWLTTLQRGHDSANAGDRIRSFVIRAHYARNGQKISHTDWYELRRSSELEVMHAASWTNTSYRHLSVIACLMWIGLDVVFDEPGKPGSAADAHARADTSGMKHLRAATMMLLNTPFGLSQARVFKEHDSWAEGEAWFKAHCMDRQGPPEGHQPFLAELIEHMVWQFEARGISLDEIEQAFDVPPAN